MELDDNLKQRALGAIQALKEGKAIQVKKPEPKPTPEPEPTPTIVSLPEAGKIRTNDELRKSILELQDAIPLPVGGKKMTKTQVNNMNKQDLEKTLASLTEQGLAYNKAKGVPVEAPLFESVKQADGSEVAKPIAQAVDAKMAASALFHFNYILVKVAELASVNLQMKEKVGSDLEGLSEDIMKDRKDLERILERIANDHGPQIAKYLTPINEYALFMLGATSNRLLANKKKISSTAPIAIAPGDAPQPQS